METRYEVIRIAFWALAVLFCVWIVANGGIALGSGEIMR